MSVIHSLFVNLRFGRLTELSRSKGYCSRFIFIKYNVELFLLIDKIIRMGKDNSLFLPEKITCYLKMNQQIGNCYRHAITI